MIFTDESENGSFVFLIWGRAPELWIRANGTNGSKFAILAVPKKEVKKKEPVSLT